MILTLKKRISEEGDRERFPDVWVCLRGSITAQRVNSIGEASGVGVSSV